MRITRDELEALRALTKREILAYLEAYVVRPRGRPPTGRKTWAEYKRAQRARQKGRRAAS